MSRGRFVLPLGAFAIVCGCQAIADLHVPTYRASTSSSQGAGGAGAGGGSGGAPATGGSGGGDACATLATGQGGACTKTDADTPPCLEHLKLWLAADREACLTKDAAGAITAWRDASRFGWTATTVGAAAWEASGTSGHAVHLSAGGMQLDPHGKTLDLAGVSIFAALDWATLPPEDDGANYPFGIGDVLCLTSRFSNAQLDFLIGGQSGSAHFEAYFDDGSQQNRLTVSNTGIGAGAWDLYGARWSCDASCGADGGPTRAGFVDKDTFIGNDVGHPSLDPKNLKMQVTYETAYLGAKCSNPAQERSDVRVGEILLYDAYVDDAMNQAIYNYLDRRWAK